MHLHSSAQGEAFTRGGLTSRERAGSRPARSISLTPRGSGAEVAFIASRKSQVARLQTNSPVSSMKLTESCLLYTSDAADDLLCVDLGGRRIIKKKKKKL